MLCALLDVLAPRKEQGIWKARGREKASQGVKLTAPARCEVAMKGGRASLRPFPLHQLSLIHIWAAPGPASALPER